MMASEWFYTLDGKEKSGPVSSAQLQALVRYGHLLPTDLVWKEGMAWWTPASKVNGLFPSPPALSALPPIPQKGQGEEERRVAPSPKKRQALRAVPEQARLADEEDEFVRPSKRKKSQPSVPVWLWLAGIPLLGLLLLCGGGLWMISGLLGGGELTQANFDKLETGMSEKEVENILGKGETYLDVSSPGMDVGSLRIPGSSMSGKKWESGKPGQLGYKLIVVTFKDGKLNGKVRVGLR
jgi:hypothetical protein